MRIAITVILGLFSGHLLAQNPSRAFSHQAHLKAKLTCLTCHPAAAASTAATDANMPAEQICLGCHNGDALPRVDTSSLTEKKPAARIFRFNHQFHLQMGNVAPLLAAAIDDGKYLGTPPSDLRARLDTENACEACHRGLEETDAAGKANLPRMPDCLVCHSNVDNPFSCEKCHLEGVNLKPASHTREFADAHSTGRLGLDKTTCLPCHGRHFTCMGCH